MLALGAISWGSCVTLEPSGVPEMADLGVPKWPTSLYKEFNKERYDEANASLGGRD